ncbi:MAG: putative DNA modification/repair radical SAM protein [Clostridia bacterium]|nr:putative DNA modification/repair radical SAM protein [Clostridia bacterium]
MLDERRLNILVDAAKYDVSCSSSGSKRQNTKNGIGNACFGGLCHSFTPDGRCISLLKILMSNDCCYDCAYCTSRRSNDVPRATATPEEICELTMGFYKRNYIEGLFLSSSIFKSPNHTMELLYETVRKLRKEYNFNGYIHLKGIPNADKLLIERTGFLVDRMSFNIELPSEKSLKLLAPQKDKNAIITPMKMLAQDKYFYAPTLRRKDFLPAGQTTQMIVGASPESDAHILKLTEFMYRTYKLKRVYYSTYTPTNFDTSLLPYEQAPLIREHRLYQADWLLRFYGFTADEITGTDGFLSTDYDPKCAWALKNPQLFPVEINTASPEMLLRIPGVGVKSAYRIMQARKHAKLDFSDLKRLRVVLKRAVHFITCKGKFLGGANERVVKNLLIGAELNQNAKQLSIFNNYDSAVFSAITGEL